MGKKYLCCNINYLAFHSSSKKDCYFKARSKSWLHEDMYLGERFKHELREICKFRCPCTGSNFLSMLAFSINPSRHILVLFILVGKWGKLVKIRLFSPEWMENKQNQSSSSSIRSGQSGLNVQAEVDFLNYSEPVRSEIKKRMFFWQFDWMSIVSNCWWRLQGNKPLVFFLRF